MREKLIGDINRLANLGSVITRGLDRGVSRLIKGLPIKRENSTVESFDSISDYSLSFLRWGGQMARDDVFLRALGGVTLIGIGMVTDRMITGVGIYITLKNAKAFHDLSRDIKE